MRAEDFVFVDRAFGDFGEEEFPDAGRATRAHGMDTAVPAIHIADDADARRGRRPYGEMCAGDTGDSVKVCAEFFVGVKMAAFADEVEIEVGEEKREGVRIENLEGFTVGAELNFVAAWLGGGRLVGRPDGFEEAFRTEFDAVGNFRRRHGGILEDDAGFGGPRNQETNRPAFRDGMRAEDAEGVGVGCGEEGIGADVEVGERFGGGGGSRCRARLGIFGRHGAIVRQEGRERKRYGGGEEQGYKVSGTRWDGRTLSGVQMEGKCWWQGFSLYSACGNLAKN